MQATICLHNYLRLTENANYTPEGFVDREDSSGNIVPGDWSSEVLATLTRLEAIDTHLRQEEHEMTLSHTLTVLRREFLANSNMS